MNQPREPKKKKETIYQRNPNLGKVSESMIPALKGNPQSAKASNSPQAARPPQQPPAAARPAASQGQQQTLTGRGQHSRQKQAQNRAAAQKHQGRSTAPGKIKPEHAQRLRRKDPLRSVGKAIASPFTLPPAAKGRHKLVKSGGKKTARQQQQSQQKQERGTAAKQKAAPRKPVAEKTPEYAPWAGAAVGGGAAAPSSGATDFRDVFGKKQRSAENAAAAATSGHTAMRGRTQTHRPQQQRVAPAAATTGTCHMREQMLSVGRYIWAWGRGRGTVALFLLLLAFFWPILHAPPMSSDAAVMPPAFLAGYANAYALITPLGIFAAGIAILFLPMFARGLVLIVLGFAPFVAYYAATLTLDSSAYAMPAAVAEYAQLAYFLFPAWVAMAAGMIVGQNFPEWLPGRFLAALGALAVIGVEFFGGIIMGGGGVDFFANPVVALLRLLVLALALTAIGTLIRPSIVASVSFVKAGMLYLLTVPALFVLYQGVGLGTALPPPVFYQSLHALLFMLGALLVAIVGLSEVLHTFAWNREVRDTLGKTYTGLDPRTIDFEERYLACGIAEGILGEEDAALLRQERKLGHA